MAVINSLPMSSKFHNADYNRDGLFSKEDKKKLDGLVESFSHQFNIEIEDWSETESGEYITYIDVPGFTSDMYKIFHPHGKLGASLLKVSELMHTGLELPMVNLDASMTDVLSVMGREIRFGSVGIVDKSGKLVGVFTDGDIRRKLTQGINIMEKKIVDIMNPSPKTVCVDELASSALLKINENKIQVLFVVDNILKEMASEAFSYKIPKGFVKLLLKVGLIICVVLIKILLVYHYFYEISVGKL